MSCTLFKLELLVRLFLDIDFVLVNSYVDSVMFSFDSVLCQFLTCNVLNFIVMSKHSLVSWLVFVF